MSDSRKASPPRRKTGHLGCTVWKSVTIGRCAWKVSLLVDVPEKCHYWSMCQSLGKGKKKPTYLIWNKIEEILYTFTCTCKCTCTHTYRHEFSSLIKKNHIFNKVKNGTRDPVCACLSVRTCMYVCMYACVYVYTYIHVCMCAYVQKSDRVAKHRVNNLRHE